ncbi:uncharacterized protein PHALS_10307 [Plasmopara halstedii]|uniref:Uncharacterized protein n=1 Tax=Plasmopara halstedii TaxID=4781 RepID=A0A0P1AHD3_PLAHL|nr:uncharacterized protein PHALS_10307 [Plasmopara halstedii]CEG40087.1 hypothetical protein PHALS_10307 [Plasmopara halstedii]|eukprot:XP_024576456.1 hypothetical protein PHALS_10307 [Plasmopara halstedii]
MPTPEDASAQSGQRFLKQMVPYDPNQNDERGGFLPEWFVESATNALVDLQNKFALNKYKLATRLIAESKINPLEINFFTSDKLLEVVDKITKAFIIKSRSPEAIFYGLSHVAGDKEYGMLASLARGLGVFKARGKYEIHDETYINSDIQKGLDSEDVKGMNYNRLREIVLKFEPFLLSSWKRLGVSAEQAEEILEVDFSRLYFLENPNLPLYIKYLTMTPRYEHLGPYETLLLDMKKKGLREDCFGVAGWWCNDRTQFYPTKVIGYLVFGMG